MALLKIYNPIIAEEQRLDLYWFYGIDGVCFKDVDGFIASIPAEDEVIDIRLHCQGGDVSEGWAIVDKLRATGKKITATIEGQCASMATVILLAASERKGAKHATMLIHDPYYPEYTLADSYRAEDLEKLAGSLRDETTRILDFYVERTGADRAVLEALMKQEEFVGMQRAKELGFIHEIIEPRSASTAKGNKAAAWKERNQKNQNSNSMTKKKNNKGLLAAIAVALGVDFPRAVNYELNTAAGDTITIDKPDGEDPMVGDSASPDGEHLMPDGKTIIITDGIITEILDPEGDGDGDGDGDGNEDEELASAQARIVELEAECASLRKNAKTVDEKRILNLVAIAGGEAWLTRAKSNYKPQGRVAPVKKDKVDPQKQSLVSKKLEEARRKAAGNE
jgi:ATP-dependent Clp protease, proteolytic subunit ClpP